MGSLSGMSGISLMLTLSLITLVAVECLKTNTIVENFEEVQTGDNTKENFGSSDWEKVSNKAKNQIEEYEQQWINRVNNSKPTPDELKAIGSSPPDGDFPFVEPYSNYYEKGNESTVPDSSSNDRSKNIGLCAQNYNTFGVSTLGQPAMNGVASSLLPQSAKGDNSKVKGFEDCDNKNVLASQFLLTDTQIGIDTTNGSKKDQLYDLRAAPSNPHDFVGIWGLSTKYENLERNPIEDNTIISTGKSRTIFKKLDTNNDDSLTFDEFSKYGNLTR